MQVTASSNVVEYILFGVATVKYLSLYPHFQYDGN